MVKSTAKKLLALLLSAMLLFSAFGGALSVFAEDESTEDIYGTSASGYYSKGSASRNVATTDGPKNLDFSEGYKYWSSKYDKTGYASDMLVMEEETDGTRYVRTVKASDIVTDDDGNSNYTLESYKGIETAPFKISSDYAGKEIHIIARYKNTQAAIDENAKNQTDIGIKLFYLVTTTQEDGTTKTEYKDVGFVESSGTNHIKADAYNTKMKDTGVLVDADSQYVIMIQDSSEPYAKGAFKENEYTHVSEIILAVKNDDGSYTDISNGEKIYKDGNPYGGTAEKGIVDCYFDDSLTGVVDVNQQYKKTHVFVPTTGLQNADFSNGFKFWTLNQYEQKKIPEVLSIAEQASVEDGVVSFKAVSSENGTLYPGISSCLFSIPGIKAGDKLVLTVEQRNALVNQLRLREVVINGSNNYATSVAQVEGSGGNDKASWMTVATPELTVSSDNALFGVYLQRGESTTGQIRNFRIYKVTEDGGYIDITNGYDAENATVIDNKNGGTEKDGVLDFNTSLTSSVTYTNAYSKMMNGDFSEGLKYWSVKTDKTGYASAVAAVTAEGALVTNGRYDGLKSPTVVVPDSLDGKTLAVRVGFNSYETKSFDFKLYVNGTKTKTVNIGGDLSNNVRFNDVTLTAGDKLTVEFQANEVEGSKFLIKYVDFCTVEGDNSYLSFDGVTRYANDGKDVAAPLGGTEEDGLYNDQKWNGVAYLANNGYATEGLQNGNFSQGFKYWRLRYSTADTLSSNYLSAQAAVDKATGIVSFKEVSRNDGKSDPLYAGLVSSGFYLKSLKANDTLYAALDFRGATSGGTISVGLRAYNTETGSALQMYERTKDDGTPVYDNGEHWGSSVKNIDTEAWKTVYSQGVTTDGENIVFSAHMQRYYNAAEGEIANFRILRADRGGLENAPKVNLDGTLDTSAGQLYGDANNDGAVDLIDLVRMKKYASDSTSNAIFLAAVDMDNDDAINASDLAAVVKAIIDPTYTLSK